MYYCSNSISLLWICSWRPQRRCRTHIPNLLITDSGRSEPCHEIRGWILDVAPLLEATCYLPLSHNDCSIRPLYASMPILFVGECFHTKSLATYGTALAIVLRDSPQLLNGFHETFHKQLDVGWSIKLWEEIYIWSIGETFASIHPASDRLVKIGVKIFTKQLLLRLLFL